MNASFPPFKNISERTQGHVLDRPITIDQQRQLEKLSSDLHVAAVALDAAITRIQNEHLPVEANRLTIALMWCGQFRINVNDVLSQCMRPDAASAASAELYEKTYKKKLRRVA